MLLTSHDDSPERGSHHGYIIDTGSLIRIGKHYPVDADIVWNGLINLVESGILRTVSEVLVELERNDEESYRRLKPLTRSIVIKETAAILLVVREIGDEFPRLVGVGIPHGQNRADAYVIAAARVNGMAVVSDESRNDPKQRRIPAACDHFGVECIDLRTLLNHEGIL